MEWLEMNPDCLEIAFDIYIQYTLQYLLQEPALEEL